MSCKYSFGLIKIIQIEYTLLYLLARIIEIVYVDKYEYEYKSKLTGYESWESQIIYIRKGNTLNKGINLINIYRPPNNLVDKCNEIIKEISPEIKKLESNKNEAIIAGDFNLDLVKLNEKNQLDGK